MMKCEKIPALITLEECEGDYFEYEEKVYEAYRRTYEQKKIYYEGKPVYQKKMPLYKEKSCTFWHIISSGENEQERDPDMRRYERICWPGYILEHCTNKCSDILKWENMRKGKARVLIWCKAIKYLVILDKRKDYYLFWTAYPITYKNMERKLQQEYEDYIKNNAKAAH